MALIAESRTFSSSGTLAAPRWPRPWLPWPARRRLGRPVALCEAELAALIASLIPLRSGSLLKSALFFSISLRAGQRRLGLFTAASVPWSASRLSTSISFSCSLTVALACSKALFPFVVGRLEVAEGVVHVIADLGDLRGQFLKFPWCALASRRRRSWRLVASITWFDCAAGLGHEDARALVDDTPLFLMVSASGPCIFWPISGACRTGP